LKKTDVEISGNGEIGAPGMIFKAVSKWNIDLNKSLMIGDKKTDLIATKKSNLKFIKKKYNLLKEIKKNLKSK